jgi:hypothetical protein
MSPERPAQNRPAMPSAAPEKSRVTFAPSPIPSPPPAAPQEPPRPVFKEPPPEADDGAPPRPTFKEPSPEVEDLPPRPAFREPPPEADDLPPRPSFVEPPPEVEEVIPPPPPPPVAPVVPAEAPVSPVSATPSVPQGHVKRQSSLYSRTGSPSPKGSRSSSPQQESFAAPTSLLSRTSPGQIRGPRMATRGPRSPSGSSSVSSLVATMNRKSGSPPQVSPPTIHKRLSSPPRPTSVFARGSFSSRTMASDAEDNVVDRK